MRQKHALRNEATKCSIFNKNRVQAAALGRGYCINSCAKRSGAHGHCESSAISNPYSQFLLKRETNNDSGVFEDVVALRMEIVAYRASIAKFFRPFSAE